MTVLMQFCLDGNERKVLNVYAFIVALFLMAMLLNNEIDQYKSIIKYLKKNVKWKIKSDARDSMKINEWTTSRKKNENGCLERKLPQFEI